MLGVVLGCLFAAAPTLLSCDMVLDAVVVGNGPCGMALVAALTGKVTARYDGRHRVKPFDEVLRRVVGKGGALREADLRSEIDVAALPYASTRSKNPAALFYDALAHPFADSTAQHYPPCLSYTDDPTGLNILGVGSGPYGGSWSDMTPSMASLSPGHWMELPGMPITEWGRKNPESGYVPMRPSRESVALYYKEYPKAVGIDGMVKENKRVEHAEPDENGAWKITITDVLAQTTEVVKARNLILANGMYSNPKKLGIPGENELAYVHHRVPKSFDGVLLVVGAGLSAADCIVGHMKSGGKIIHVFRGAAMESPLAKFKDSSVAYQEYTRLLDLMQGLASSPDYTPYPNHTVESFKPDGMVMLSPPATLSVTKAAVLVGSLPDFSFFPVSIRDTLSSVSDIVERKFSLSVDPWDLSVPGVPNLYAAGPIRGDNFVRFITGDSVVIAKSILEKKRQKE